MWVINHCWGVAKSTLAAIEKGCGGDTYAARFHFCFGVSPASLGDTRRHWRHPDTING